MTYPYTPAEKWDVHTHTTLSPETYERLSRFSAYADFVRVRAHASKPCCAEMVNSRGDVLRVIENNAYDGAVRINDCDRHRVTVQILSPTPMMIPDKLDDPEDAETICKILNDDNAAIAATNPKRFLALGALPMMTPDRAIREMERIKSEHNMRGVEINSNINGMDLGHPHLYPVFEAASALNMAIFVHPWGGFMNPSEQSLNNRMSTHRNWRPWLTGMPLETAIAFDSLCRARVHEKLPKLRVLYAHGGGAFPALMGRMEHGAYCRPDLFKTRSQTNLYDIIEKCGIYTDTLTHSPLAFQTLLNTMGAGRIAMGSDYPYPLGEIDPFDLQTQLDPQGNRNIYPRPKSIYPGHMIEHLPGPGTGLAEAWPHFNWLPSTAADGTPRELPRLTDPQRQRILSGTAKEWLGLSQ